MEKRKSREMEACEPDDEDINFDIGQFDTNTTEVQAVDGCLIGTEEGLVKLIFYHFKPDIELMEGEQVRCKCILEARISKSRFIEMANELYRKAMDLSNRENTDTMFT